ncbi:MAG: hypothetical protein Q8O83_03565 [bacterium]|nr:hypothetical protein [bacterium]
MKKSLPFIGGVLVGLFLFYAYSSFIMPANEMEVRFKAYRKIDDPTKIDLQIRLDSFEKGVFHQKFLDAHLQLDTQKTGFPFTVVQKEGIYVPLPVQTKSIVFSRPDILLMRPMFPVRFSDYSWPSPP